MIPPFPPGEGLSDAMIDDADIVDLLRAPDPHLWAMDNLALLGRGARSRVYAHPTDDGFVIRVSPFCRNADGWFAYAHRMTRLADDQVGTMLGDAVRRHAPKSLATYHLSGDGNPVLVAVTERLKEVSLDEDRQAVRIASRIVLRRSKAAFLGEVSIYEGLDARDAALATCRVLAATQFLPRETVDRFVTSRSSLLTFVGALPPDCLDVHASNWMLRGGDLVLNDPLTDMMPEEAAEFVLRHGTPDDHSSPLP